MAGKNRTLVIAPHPDDETLGAAGTLLRRKAEGAKIGWVIVTQMPLDSEWDSNKANKRNEEICRITQMFGFDKVVNLGFPAAQLDHIPINDVVAALGDVIKSFEPDEVLVPHYSDVHTDHGVVFNAVAACTKWFRYPSVCRVLAYEVLSETDFGIKSGQNFRPSVYVNIEEYLEDKLIAMEVYESEIGEYPFPRSREAIRALATLRGSASGFKAAEAFELLRERIL